MSIPAFAAALACCLVMAVVALAAVGAYTLCRLALGWGQAHGDRRAWKRAAALTGKSTAALVVDHDTPTDDPADDPAAGINRVLNTLRGHIDTQPGTDQDALDTCERLWRQTPNRAWEEDQ